MEARTCQICYDFLLPALRNYHNCTLYRYIIPLLWYRGSGAIIRPVNVGLSAISLCRFYDVYFSHNYISLVRVYKNVIHLVILFHCTKTKPKRVCLVNVFFFHLLFIFFLCKSVFHGLACGRW